MEGDEFKIIQSLDLIGQSRGFTQREKTVYVALFLDAYHTVDGLLQQVAIMFHVSAVAGFLTQQGTKISVVFLLVLAEQSQGIQ